MLPEATWGACRTIYYFWIIFRANFKQSREIWSILEQSAIIGGKFCFRGTSAGRFFIVFNLSMVSMEQKRLKLSDWVEKHSARTEAWRKYLLRIWWGEIKSNKNMICCLLIGFLCNLVGRCRRKMFHRSRTFRNGKLLPNNFKRIWKRNVILPLKAQKLSENRKIHQIARSVRKSLSICLSFEKRNTEKCWMTKKRWIFLRKERKNTEKWKTEPSGFPQFLFHTVPARQQQGHKAMNSHSPRIYAESTFPRTSLFPLCGIMWNNVDGGWQHFFWNIASIWLLSYSYHIKSLEKYEMNIEYGYDISFLEFASWIFQRIL